MKIEALLTDEAALRALGFRLKGVRLSRNLSQTGLAEQAGISRSTVDRLEKGAVATQLSVFLRVCRVLGLLEGFDKLIPEQTINPIDLVKLEGRKRKRASRKRAKTQPAKKWTWGDSK